MRFATEAGMTARESRDSPTALRASIIAKYGGGQVGHASMCASKGWEFRVGRLSSRESYTRERASQQVRSAAARAALRASGQRPDEHHSSAPEPLFGGRQSDLLDGGRTRPR